MRNLAFVTLCFLQMVWCRLSEPTGTQTSLNKLSREQEYPYGPADRCESDWKATRQQYRKSSQKWQQRSWTCYNMTLSLSCLNCDALNSSALTSFSNVTIMVRNDTVVGTHDDDGDDSNHHQRTNWPSMTTLYDSFGQYCQDCPENGGGDCRAEFATEREGWYVESLDIEIPIPSQFIIAELHYQCSDFTVCNGNENFQ